MPGIDRYAASILHFDGTDGSTVITESSTTARTWTANGNAQLDTADFKFGTASLLCDGAGDYLSTPDSTEITLGSNDFTIDFWFKIDGATGTNISPAGQTSSSGGANTNSAWFVERNGSSNTLRFIITNSSNTTPFIGATSFSSTENPGWHHMACVRSSHTVSMFVDGILEATGAYTLAINDSSAALSIGRPGEFNGQYWQGWIDEFRLSVGVARWTSNFTPPAAPYDEWLAPYDTLPAITTPPPSRWLKTSAQQFLTTPSRYLPTPAVTATLSAAEVNTDAVALGVNVYEEEDSAASQAGAKVTVYEVDVGDGGAASLRES